VWNASEFGGVDKLYVPVSKLWIPDIILSNKYVKRLTFKSTTVYAERRTPALFEQHCMAQEKKQ